jgi:hypothetical protein
MRVIPSYFFLSKRGCSRRFSLSLSLCRARAFLHARSRHRGCSPRATLSMPIWHLLDVYVHNTRARSYVTHAGRTRARQVHSNSRFRFTRVHVGGGLHARARAREQKPPSWLQPSPILIPNLSFLPGAASKMLPNAINDALPKSGGYVPLTKKYENSQGRFIPAKHAPERWQTRTREIINASR